MILTVKKYEGPPLDYHVCEDEEGNRHFVDLIVNGDFRDQTDGLQGDSYIEFLHTLVGKMFEVDYLHPHLVLAMNVKPYP